MAERGVRIAEAGVATVKLRREELNGNTADGASRIAKKAAAPFKFMKRDEIELELRKADSKLQEAKRELEEKKKFYKSLEWDALSPEEKEAQLQAKWKKEEHARELAREREEYFRRKRVEERRAREEAAREEAERAAREAASQEASRESSQESEAQEVPAPKRRRGVPKRGTGAHARR